MVLVSHRALCGNGKKHGKMARPNKPRDVNSYICQFPADVQAITKKRRATIHNAALKRRKLSATFGEQKRLMVPLG
jgi:hypothetical protein